MIDLEAYLYEKAKSIIAQWDEEGIYAISFFVYSNEAFSYQGHENISEFSIGYNTENDCNHASAHSEERWNFAFWRHNQTYIIDPSEEGNEGIEVLFQWYKENGIENIGLEDIRSHYDANMRYIGKGPVGFYELLTVVSAVARRMQTEGFVSEKFGSIPIIVHELEYPWYVEEATARANPNGEADAFLEAIENGFV